MQSNEGSKHFTGRINESQSFTHNTVKTYKSYYSVSAILVFLYILTIFQCQFWSVKFFSLLLYQVSKVMGVQALRKMLCLSAGLPQWSSLLQSWCSLMCLCVSVPPLMLWTLYPYPPSFTFTKACPSLPQCDSISLILSVPFSFHMPQSVIYHDANFVFHPLHKHCWHRLSLQRLCRHNSFYMQQSNATPRPSTPSSGSLPQFPIEEEVKGHSSRFFLIVHIQMVTLK